MLVVHCSFTNSLVCLIFSLAAVVFLSSTRSLLLTIDEMYILAVVASDCRSIAFFTISSAMPVGDLNSVLLFTQFVPTCRTISCTSLMSVGRAAVAGTAPLVLLIVTVLPHSLPKPYLLRANVIESPMTNASLQASAVAGCYVGVALAGVCTFSGIFDDWQTQRCFRAPSWISSCRRNSAAILSPSRCSIDAISSATTVCTIVFSLSNSACVIFGLTMVIIQVICSLMPEANTRVRPYLSMRILVLTFGYAQINIRLILYGYATRVALRIPTPWPQLVYYLHNSI